MNVGLIDVDETQYPNIVLMKLSTYHKAKGDNVFLLKPSDILCGGGLFTEYDKLIGACVFTRNMPIVKQLREYGAIVAGIGTDDKRVLPDEIEHLYPDYSLYGVENKAYGFLTRGCPRHCPFCVVGDKEGLVSHKVADLSEFWNGQKEIYICDPNLLACKDRLDLLDQLIESKSWVDVNQGFDIRFVTEEIVEKMNKIKIKCVHFAWDNPRDKAIKKKFEMFSRLSRIKNHASKEVFVLTNYWSTLDEDLERIYWLKEQGYDPYVTVFDKEHAPIEIRHLQRYVNNRKIFRTLENFDEYEALIKRKGRRAVESEQSLF